MLMEIPLKMYKAVINYFGYNKISTFVGFYFFVSVILKVTTRIDICIPCVWKSVFRFECPGCGLTTAFVSLLKLDYQKSLESNWLIFVIVPIGLFYITQGFIGNYKKNKAY